MSDLHLGEEDSVFLSLDDKGKATFNPDVAQGIRKIIRDNVGEAPIDFLILAGDAVDLSLATRADAFHCFREFLAIFADVAETIVYLPGNHDHHLWVALQEDARVFSQLRQGREPMEFYDVFISRVYPDRIEFEGGDEPGTPYGSKTFLYHLLPESVQQEARKNFLVAYPNIHLEFEKKVLITHGHFFEEMWTLFTDVLPKSLGYTRPNFRELEEINSPFTEFGWYDLGQAGKLSDLMEALYDNLHSGKSDKVDMVLDEVADYLDKRLDFKPKGKQGLFDLLKGALSGTLKEFASDELIQFVLALVKQFAKSQITPEEPSTPGAPLRHADILDSDDARARIIRYLKIATSEPDVFDTDTLIFGHTHVPIIPKPDAPPALSFQTAVGPRAVTVYNTGGWVTDVLKSPELRASRPAVFAIRASGAVENIVIPWPAELDFRKQLEAVRDDLQKKQRIKALISTRWAV
jgi:UDP-2,3-diacylglucosamine pyrophosphatase LpxH